MNTAEKISKIRIRSGKNQTEFAKFLGVSRSAISKIESGERVPSIKMLRKISEAYSVDLIWLQDDNSASMNSDVPDESKYDFEKIINYLATPGSLAKIDVSFLLYSIAQLSIEKSVLFKPTVWSLPDEYKRSIITSNPILFQSNIEVVSNSIFKTSTDFKRFVSKLSNDSLDLFLIDNAFNVLSVIKSNGSSEVTKLRKELYQMFYKEIELNSFLLLLKKYNLISFSNGADLAEQYNVKPF